MARAPTRFSRVSTGYKDSVNTIAETGHDLSFIDGVGTTLDVTTLTATGGASIGGGDQVKAISTATAAITLGAITPLESSSVVTCALSGATRGDAIFITVDSLYNRVDANRDVLWMASSGSTAGEVNVWGVNSTLTSVTPTAATTIRLVRMNFATYV